MFAFLRHFTCFFVNCNTIDFNNISLNEELPNLGLGIDWGVAFSGNQFRKAENTDKKANETEIVNKESQEAKFANKVCVYNFKQVVTKYGICSLLGSCHIDHVGYFGSYCHGLVPGTSCQVETDQYTAVQGTCSPGGHCKGLQGQVRLQHEACTGTRRALGMEHNKMDKVKQFLRKTTKPLITREMMPPNLENLVKSKSSLSKCRGLYNPSAYKKLENICTDCYNLYKEPEVHTYCMSGCFDSSFFLTCVKNLMVEEEMVIELVKMVGKK